MIKKLSISTICVLIYLVLVFSETEGFGNRLLRRNSKTEDSKTNKSVDKSKDTEDDHVDSDDDGVADVGSGGVLSVRSSKYYDSEVLLIQDDVQEGPLVVGDMIFWASHKSGVLYQSKDDDDTIWVLAPATDTFIPHGLAYDENTNTLVVTSEETTGKGAVYRVDMNGDVINLTPGMKFNSPNDVAVTKDGTIYFTDPLWFQHIGTPEFTEKERLGTVVGLYSISNDYEDGTVKLEYDFGLKAQPNGLVFTPDESYLFVALTFSNEIVKFKYNNKKKELKFDGELDSQRDKEKFGYPDGIVISQDYLFIASNRDFIEARLISSYLKESSKSKDEQGDQEEVDSRPSVIIMKLRLSGGRSITNLDFDKDDGTIYLTQGSSSNFSRKQYEMLRLEPSNSYDPKKNSFPFPLD